ncbi:hypothetical protein JKP88DRAFT_264905 [Tribonema minus]|uniref:Uncharacterized protein n=1 Tax=Tribonema minus TaxID=303371 RepID=A0A835YMC3_9STRA|nr:hypothetical protein JKP88DRAFT_264905 [Tribonema minus]
MSGLMVSDKRVRVYNYQRKTVRSALDILGAAGVRRPHQVTRHHLMLRTSGVNSSSFADHFPPQQPERMKAAAHQYACLSPALQAPTTAACRWRCTPAYLKSADNPRPGTTEIAALRAKHAAAVNDSAVHHLFSKAAGERQGKLGRSMQRAATAPTGSLLNALAGWLMSAVTSSRASSAYTDCLKSTRLQPSGASPLEIRPTTAQASFVQTDDRCHLARHLAFRVTMKPAAVLVVLMAVLACSLAASPPHPRLRRRELEAAPGPDERELWGWPNGGNWWWDSPQAPGNSFNPGPNNGGNFPGGTGSPFPKGQAPGGGH